MSSVFTKLEIQPISNNHLIATFRGEKALYSYGTLVAAIAGDSVYVTSDWETSKTTVRHVSNFLGTVPAEIRRRIASGSVVVL